MLGEKLLDPDRIESANESLPGLGFFPMETVFTPDKKTERVAGQALGWPIKYAQAEPMQSSNLSIEGYEIHMGRSSFIHATEHPMTIGIARGEPAGRTVHQEGARSANGKVWGTYIHGILHNDEFRRNWLNAIRESKGWLPLAGELRFNEQREAEFDRLAEHVRRFTDMQAIYAIMNFSEEADQ
ncbi:hypothetical protein [Cohnella cholangitidis]|uniref:hypothetical protein n=1 Tax=Cohnella cholangitidis TaxID=2598458 RepID=UPI002D21BE7E|nr:hypothetical protein [Cohnella cholangitidis]